MNKQAWVIAKLNLKNIKTPYFVTGIVFAVICVQSVVLTIVATAGGRARNQLSISSGSYLWLLIIMAAIFIPKNFRRIVNLGGKRNGFFWGSLTCYAILSGAVTAAHMVLYHTYERLLMRMGHHVGYGAFIQNPALMDNHYVSVDVTEVFGWFGNGTVVAFFQQFAFLFMLACVIHTFTAVQNKWYGWVTDAIIAAILGIFIPIAPLRAVLLSFFNIIIFDVNPAIQIAACMLLAAVAYALSKPVFARKAI